MYVCIDNEDRNPPKAIPYLEKGCSINHPPCCYNLAVLYGNGDTGVQKREELFNQYKQKTEQLIGAGSSLRTIRVK